MIHFNSVRLRFFALLWVLPALVSLQPVQAATITGLKVFGDSLSDQGNSAFIMPAVPYYEGRWSNGPVWVEYLNGSLGLLPITSNSGVAATGSNFAYGGSTSGAEAEIYPPEVQSLLPNLQEQVSSYRNNTAGAGPNASIATDLFIVWSGGNDVINRVEGGPAVDPTVMAANISSAINNLYLSGARQFLIPNLPPLGEKPDFRLDEGQRTAANELAVAFNEALGFELDQLEEAHGDIDILRLNIYGLVSAIIDDPLAFGLNNVTDLGVLAPEGDATGYLFWDTTHPTTYGHQLIAQEALGLVPEPASVFLLGLGLGLSFVLFARKRQRKTPDLAVRGL